MDPASRELTDGLPSGIPETLAARAAYINVALSTLGHRKLERPLIEAKPQDQQYLTRYEENAVIEFLLQKMAFGRPMRMIHIPAIAFSATRMDETGIMLSMLNSVKVLIGKYVNRGYRGTRVKRDIVTALECSSADGRSLNLMIIWPAKTHRSN
ncbi:hypothetical protein J1614_010728 [Plenodomus biglobosus]|nr:hypothetical protein J1614_010728 [Plenodomus biglobosus]